MKQITLHKQWFIHVPLEKVFAVMTDFEQFPARFPRVAQSLTITKRDENYLEIAAQAKSFGRVLPVYMKTHIIPSKGFISDNESPVFGTSGHEELLLSPYSDGTLIDYTYQISIHKKWLRIFATPLIRWYAMRYWEKAVINQLKKLLEK